MDIFPSGDKGTGIQFCQNTCICPEDSGEEQWE